MKSVFLEDLDIFHAQQKGIEASQFRGVIGNREERIHQFQTYLCDQLGIVPEVHPDDLEKQSNELVR